MLGSDHDSMVFVPQTPVRSCLRHDEEVRSCQPSRTLRDYTYHTRASTGFSAAVNQQLVAAAGLGTCPDRERTIVILMHIREDIVYDPVSGKPYNFTTEHANLLILFIQTFRRNGWVY